MVWQPYSSINNHPLHQNPTLSFCWTKMKYTEGKLKGDGKCRLAQAFPSPCTWQWRHCLARTPQALPSPGAQDRAGPGCPTPRWPQELCSDGTPAPTRAGQEVQIQTSTLDWSHTCNSAALLHTALHLGKKTHLHCCFLFCLLTHFFKNFYQTLFWYLGKSTKCG